MRDYRAALVTSTVPLQAPRVHLLDRTWELRLMSTTAMEFVPVRRTACRAFVGWTLTMDPEGDYVLFGQYRPAKAGNVKAQRLLCRGYRDRREFLQVVLRASAELVRDNFKPRHDRAR